MTNEMIDDWNFLLDKKVLIYGVGYSAGYLYDLIEDLGKRDSVVGFVVTDYRDNKKEYKNHKVFQIDSINSFILSKNIKIVFHLKTSLNVFTIFSYVFIIF